jgi:predicted DNA-binding transcriptional regulator AlpA
MHKDDIDIEPRFMSSRQVCKRYNISGQTFRRWRSDEALKFPRAYLISRSTLWAVAELDAFDAARPRAAA